MKNKDITDLHNWVDFVVEVTRSNWLIVLEGIFNLLGEEVLAHHRFNRKGTRIGLSVRFIGEENSKLVDSIISLVEKLKIKYSVNPKQHGDHDMECLSGWFDKLDKKEWRKLKRVWGLPMNDDTIEKLIQIWHEISQLISVPK